MPMALATTLTQRPAIVTHPNAAMLVVFSLTNLLQKVESYTNLLVLLVISN